MITRRLITCLFVLCSVWSASSPAWAQLDVPPEQELPDAKRAPSYATRVTGYRPSPQWTQDRSFTSTRFWLLDPGQYEAQVWWRQRYFDKDPSEHLFQAEVEIGVAPHLQIDLYENLTFNADDNGHRALEQEGNQIEARIAIPSYYGQIFGNPVIYLEWHPRHNQPDRGEVRLLLGGALNRRLYLALNPYVETNLESTDVVTAARDKDGMPTVVHTSKFIADAEAGTTVAVGLSITDWFRVSAEAKVGVDMLGSADNSFTFVAFAGPGFILRPLRTKALKIMGTCLFGIAGQSAGAQRYEPLLIVGSQW